MGEVALDCLLDSLKVLGFVFLFHVLLSFLEPLVAKAIAKKHSFTPAVGSLFGLIPQCGVSVVAADLYHKRHITIGTLIAVFLSCSDEALPILFSNTSSNWSTTLPQTFLLLGLKLAIGAAVGILIDILFSSKRKEVDAHMEDCEGENEIHVGCCHHGIENEHSPVKEHLIHPLVHSLKVFVFVFAVSFAFGSLVYLLGEDKIASFLTSAKGFTPLFAALVGMIPNCASSILITDLFLKNALPFSALLSGLLVNAGLGIFCLFKEKESFKYALMVLGICFAASIFSGYIAFAIESII